MKTIHKNSKHILKLASLIILLYACGSKTEQADAFGNFEAVETVVSSKVGGEITALYANEGNVVIKGAKLLQCDTSDLVLQKKQVIAQKNSALAGKAQIQASIEVLKETIDGAVNEQNRVKKLFADGAATQKQMDDIDNKINVLKKQIKVSKANLLNIQEQAKVFDAQLDVLDKKIADCSLKTPIGGTILERYVENGEMAMMGKPLFKIADLKSIILRVYISGQQLEKAKVGSTVDVKIDAADGGMRTFEGVITWISAEAEFTPKVVQTKEERVKQVYATKILVKNDGSIKIGMPGEVNLK